MAIQMHQCYLMRSSAITIDLDYGTGIDTCWDTLLLNYAASSLSQEIFLTRVHFLFNGLRFMHDEEL